MVSRRRPVAAGPLRPGSPPACGINLIGHFSAGLGLGNTARSLALLLQQKGVPFSAWHDAHAWGGPGSDARIAAHLVDAPEQLRHPLSLYVLPAVRFATLFEDFPSLRAAPRMHVANLWWEASHLPPGWAGFLGRFDALLALSGFVAETGRNFLPAMPLLVGEHPLDLPAGIGPDRRRFGFADGTVAFVASFDPNSDPARKNPEAVIEAFRRAFPPGDAAVRLGVRVNHADTAFARRVLQHLRQLAAGDARIEFLAAPMTYAEVLALYASADVHVSLHRGEGLGLGMLESMALGCPVIATGWSGNLSYMNDSNSALVGYRLVPVRGHYAFFQPGVLGPEARWAEPDLDQAVAWMRRLRATPALRRTLGAAARGAARSYQERALAAPWLGQLFELRQRTGGCGAAPRP